MFQVPAKLLIVFELQKKNLNDCPFIHPIFATFEIEI